jgi:hypothetical protein
MNMNLTLAILPYLAGILMKVAVFCLSPLAQKAALKYLVEGHKPPNKEALSTGEQNVILAVVGYSTASITAASTVIMSLIALLVIALKHHQCWLWECWAVDAILSSCMWALIYRLKGPHQPILKMSVGTFILVLSTGLDIFALVLTVLSLNAK